MNLGPSTTTSFCLSVMISIVLPTQVNANNGASDLESSASAMQEAQIYSSKGDFKKAISAYQKAADLAPDDREVQDALVSACEEQLKNNPLDPDSHIGLGKAFQLRGDYGQAEQEYQQAIRFSPGKENTPASKLLGLLPDVQRFDLARKSRHDGLIQSYTRQTKSLLEKNWHPPQHNGLLITKLILKLDPSGTIAKREIISSSGSDKEDKSVDELVESTALAPLPSALKSLDLNLSFMSDGTMNLIEVSKSQMGSPIASTPNGRPSVLSNKDDLDWGPYMAELQRKIKRSWFPPKGNESKRVVVDFRVHQAGEVSKVKIVEPSSSPAANQAASKAVQDASPFKPLPIGAKEHVEVRYTFDYNVFSGGGHGILRFD